MTVIDLTGLPTFPAETWKAGVPKAAGYTIARTSALPTSYQQATAWAKRHRRNGARVLRIHHVDKLLKADPLNFKYLQYGLDAAQRQEIPCAIEFASETPLEVSYIQALCKLNLSNVPLAAIANEAVLWEYDKWAAVARDCGFAGRLFGSNASIMAREFPGVAFGDVESAHVYTGHPVENPKGAPPGKYFFNCSYPEHSNHNADPNELIRLRPDLPYCVMECGAIYPNEDRGMSDVRLYRKLMSLGASLIVPYCYASSSIGMGNLAMGVDEWGFSAEPLRFMAFQYLAQVMAGIPAVPFSNGLQAEPAIGAVYESSPTSRVLQPGA
jgi:hypothetical protein